MLSLHHGKEKYYIDYETLIRYMLLEEILDYFEVTNAEEKVTDEREETGTVIRILHRLSD